MVTAIRAHEISKQYRLGTTVGYKTIRESMSNAAGSAFRRKRPERPASQGSIWALRHV
jgi:hypothetical protein